MDDGSLHSEAVIQAAKLCSPLTKSGSARKLIELDFVEGILSEKRFDDTMLLERLPSSDWIELRKFIRNVVHEVAALIPPDWSRLFINGPHGYIEFRLLTLWFEGRCEGRLQNKQEFLQNWLKAMRAFWKYGIDSKNRGATYHHFGNVYDDTHKGPITDICEIELLFRQVTYGSTAKERAREALALFQKPLT